MNGNQQKLISRGFDLKGWITEDLVRKFGICQSLMELPTNLNQEEIIKVLKQLDNKSVIQPRNVPKIITEEEIKVHYNNSLSFLRSHIEILLFQEEKVRKAKLDVVELIKKIPKNKRDESLSYVVLNDAHKELCGMYSSIKEDLSNYTKQLLDFPDFDSFRKEEIEARHKSIMEAQKYNESIPEMIKEQSSYCDKYKKFLREIDKLFKELNNE